MRANNIIIIAAPSARVYAQAAVALGHKVIILDAFADQETRALAQACYVVKTHDDGRLNAADFKRVFSSLDLSQIHGFLYGSWFDAAPDLLTWVASQVPVLGNAAALVRAVKSFDFFKVLDDFKILHPEVRLTPPKNTEHWLAKKLGGSGGLHITRHWQGGDYYQREMLGEPVSMLFVADGKQCQCIGFNQQLLAPTAQFPYRYGGGVGNIQLPDIICQPFTQAAQKLTTHYGLRGINSLDALMVDNTLYILELNPRLSASFAFYPHLLEAHLQACAGRLIASTHMGSVAQRVVYAGRAITISANFVWPAWVQDIPVAKNAGEGVKISSDAPICTVRAEAKTSEAALHLVLQRAQAITEKLYEQSNP